MYSLTGPAFFRFAYRLGAYQGVIAARMAEKQQQGPAVTAAGPGAGPGMNPGTRESLEAFQGQLAAQAPGAPQLFSFGTFTKAG